MLSNLPPNILIYCIIPLLSDESKRSLHITCKIMFKAVDRCCLADKRSVSELCHKGELLIIYKRKLSVSAIELFTFICKSGYINLVRRSIETFKLNIEIFDWGLEGACEGGHHSIIDLMIKHKSNDWDGALVKACYGGHREIVDLMIKKGAIDFTGGIAGACEGGYWEIVEFLFTLIREENYNWGFWLDRACKGGHEAIINTLIATMTHNGNAGEIERGLVGACEGGHYKIVEQMISLLGEKISTSSLYDGLYEACECGYEKIADRMISLLVESRIPSDNYIEIWIQGLNKACEGGHHKIIDRMLKLIGNDMLDELEEIEIWAEGIYGSCAGGHQDVFDKIMSLFDVKLINKAMCDEDNIEYMAKGLSMACLRGHHAIVDRMILLLKKYENVEIWSSCLASAYDGGHRDLVDLMFSLLSPLLGEEHQTWLKDLKKACENGESMYVNSLIDDCVNQQKPNNIKYGEEIVLKW